MMNQNMFCSNNNQMNNHIPNPNPSSIEDIINNNPYLYFPDPFLDDHNLLIPTHFLSQQQIFNTGDQQEQDQKQDQNSDKSTRNNNNKVKKMKKRSSNRRTGKKDRHSKIYTAQGLRDRRMRLSLQIARKFFDLQDMLGFDKASHTIDWLISNSNSAIQDLKQHHGSNQVIHDAVSEINNDHKDHVPVFVANKPTRESRARARARASQRTVLKKTQLFSISHHQDGILDQTHLQDCPTPTIHHKVFDDLLDFSSIHGFFSDYNNWGWGSELLTLWMY